MTRYWQPDEADGYSKERKAEIALVALRDDIPGAIELLSDLAWRASIGKNDAVRNAVVSILASPIDRIGVGALLHVELVDAQIAKYDASGEWYRLADEYTAYAAEARAEAKLERAA